MDKDLYIELLENEMRRIRAGADVTHSLVEYQKLRERYAQCEMDLYDRDHECQDLKLENDHLRQHNDRLRQQNEIMQHFIKSVRCKGLVCENCDLHFLNAHGTDLCAQVDHVKLEAIASNVLKKLEEL